MFECIISDCGLTCTRNSIKDLANDLYEYFHNEYGGRQTVIKESTDAKYKNCKLISSIGIYRIEVKNHTFECIIREK